MLNWYCFKVTHLYTVEKGASSKSHGIEIARMAGFPEKVLKRARCEAESFQKMDTIFENGPKYADCEDASAHLRKIIKLGKCLHLKYINSYLELFYRKKKDVFVCHFKLVSDKIYFFIKCFSAPIFADLCHNGN